MNLSIIVAAGRNRVIGINNQLPWHVSADLKYFKATTMGKPIIMGRKTYDSIGKPLPGRKNIVISRNDQLQIDGVECVTSVEQALKATEGTDEAMIIGGSQIYSAALQSGLVNRIYLTEVDLAPEGDAWFPELSHDWQEIKCERHPSAGDQPAYAFKVLERSNR